jgi:hypothetical protein
VANGSRNLTALTERNFRRRRLNICFCLDVVVSRHPCLYTALESFCYHSNCLPVSSTGKHFCLFVSSVVVNFNHIDITSSPTSVKLYLIDGANNLFSWENIYYNFL